MWDDFDEDMKCFKYLKCFFKCYLNGFDIWIYLILNYFIIFYNVFGEVIILLFFYKLEWEYWFVIKFFFMFLNKYFIGCFFILEVD